MFRKLLPLALTLSLLASCSPTIDLQAAATVAAAPTPNAASTPSPSPTPDAMALAFNALQAEGINVSREDGKWLLLVNGEEVPGAFFDEDGEALHIQAGDKPVDIPVEAAADRLELSPDGVLMLYDETGLTIAIFNPANPEGGWVAPGAEILGTPELQAAQTFFADKGFEITPDRKVIDQATGTEIAGLSIVAFDKNTMISRNRPSEPDPTWALQRVYEFEGKTDFTVYMTEYDLKVENGVIDMFGWVYENGEFTRQKVEFAAPNNGTVKIDGYSPEEVQEMIINNSSEDPKYKSSNDYQARRQLILNIPTKVIDFIRNKN